MPGCVEASGVARAERRLSAHVMLECEVLAVSALRTSRMQPIDPHIIAAPLPRACDEGDHKQLARSPRRVPPKQLSEGPEPHASLRLRDPVLIASSRA